MSRLDHQRPRHGSWLLMVLVLVVVLVVVLMVLVVLVLLVIVAVRLQTLREVKKGEELLVEYGASSDAYWDKIDVDTKAHKALTEVPPTPSCRGQLPGCLALLPPEPAPALVPAEHCARARVPSAHLTRTMHGAFGAGRALALALGHWATGCYSGRVRGTASSSPTPCSTRTGTSST